MAEIDDPVDAGLRFLAGLGDRYPASLRLAREAVEKSMTMPLEQGFELEADLFERATQTADASEGIRAFKEKREPAFTGR